MDSHNAYIGRIHDMGISSISFAEFNCSWLKWKSLKNGNIDDVSFPPVINLYIDTWMHFLSGIIITGLLIIVLLILLFVYKRLLMAIALIEESSKAIGHMMSTLIFPIFPFILHLIVFAIWGNVTIWLSSSGQENCKRAGIDGQISNLSVACDCAISGKVRIFLVLLSYLMFLKVLKQFIQ
uniref:Choline transporter-like protein n=1 Tax=Heterorhabditis bacteriophora TaxID=37862 RepID=A0A1I7XVB2_HETBA